MSFWQTLTQPIIGLAPMDGVTDAAFRFITARHGKPDVQCTEFIDVEEICRGIAGAWRQLRFAESERPVLAQIYGAEPERFYQVAQVLCELGFDGVDINMGCPAKSVSRRGCGAGLINNPALARAIICAAQAGVQDWASGHRIETLGLRPVVLAWIQSRRRPGPQPRRLLPVSVKTRLGYDTVVVEAWVTTLLAEQPAAITLHGRTLAQKYRGQADWEAIRRAATLVRETSTLILGNGDISTMREAVERVRETQVHGVLIGRGALGNPWLFRANAWARQPGAMRPACHLPPAVSLRERCQVALEHARYFEALGEEAYFPAMRKHLGWYCRGFPGAADVRAQLVRSRSAADVAHILAPLTDIDGSPDGQDMVSKWLDTADASQA